MKQKSRPRQTANDVYLQGYTKALDDVIFLFGHYTNKKETLKATMINVYGIEQGEIGKGYTKRNLRISTSGKLSILA
jgi:hypothetical protein